MISYGRVNRSESDQGGMAGRSREAVLSGNHLMVPLICGTVRFNDSPLDLRKGDVMAEKTLFLSDVHIECHRPLQNRRAGHFKNRPLLRVMPRGEAPTRTGQGPSDP
jgi:hypothetical protein